MIKKLIFGSLLLMGLGFSANAQVSVGIYQSGFFTHLGVGTDPEKNILEIYGSLPGIG